LTIGKVEAGVYHEEKWRGEKRRNSQALGKVSEEI
jgi:hypothetical protein